MGQEMICTLIGDFQAVAVGQLVIAEIVDAYVDDILPVIVAGDHDSLVGAEQGIC
jgi:hypothetical protein